MKPPIELRVHHITHSARLMYQEPEVYALAMAFQQHPSNPEDAFYRFADSTLKEVFSNPSQQVKLIDQEDILCFRCSQRKDCVSKTPPYNDREEAEKYHLQVGEVYTSAKLRKIISF